MFERGACFKEIGKVERVKCWELVLMLGLNLAPKSQASRPGSLPRWISLVIKNCRTANGWAGSQKQAESEIDRGEKRGETGRENDKPHLLVNLFQQKKKIARM